MVERKEKHQNSWIRQIYTGFKASKEIRNVHLFLQKSNDLKHILIQCLIANLAVIIVGFFLLPRMLELVFDVLTGNSKYLAKIFARNILTSFWSLPVSFIRAMMNGVFHNGIAATLYNLLRPKTPNLLQSNGKMLNPNRRKRILEREKTLPFYDQFFKDAVIRYGLLFIHTIISMIIDSIFSSISNHSLIMNVLQWFLRAFISCFLECVYFFEPRFIRKGIIFTNLSIVVESHSAFFLGYSFFFSLFTSFEINFFFNGFEKQTADVINFILNWVIPAIGAPIFTVVACTIPLEHMSKGRSYLPIFVIHRKILSFIADHYFGQPVTQVTVSTPVRKTVNFQPERRTYSKSFLSLTPPLKEI
eukprot:TRINITY_DN815_c0_g1_i1.p1 TRINITY_DN815_c0_g1~~TRINITY_DN815_c0_g1_i1.p1  ORF type:complete len:360 (+),score=70.57 TRINITY_DN815_c0_g1_i1:32-1111(+)